MVLSLHSRSVFHRRSVVSLLLASLVTLLTFDASVCQQMKCYRYPNKQSPQRCIPAFGNAAFNKRVISNDTCGQDKPETFCVQTGVLEVNKECEICDASKSQFAHPASYITDIKDDQDQTWWQSRSLLANPERRPVILTLDLGKSYDVSYIRIRFRSPRPESMAIYKKTSYGPDAKWVPYQYFSSSCKDTYGVDPTSYVPRNNQQKALCSDRFSSISPLTGGNVAFSTLQDRPDAYNFDNSPALQDWVTVVAIRIDLDRMNTFGDDIFGDPNVLRSYYFAIIDLAVGGKCKCNGHASECRRLQEGTDVRLVCECQHNTDGTDCEKCQPLYNDRKWARATQTNPNVCQKCECNGLATRCVFDEKRFRETGRGGVCVNCRGNTDGPNCERCKENFFRKTRNDPCLFCNCNPVGSVSLQCNSDGQCQCKPGVTGPKCNKCKKDYFGFSQNGCSKCKCYIPGTDPANTQCNEKGECSCKRHVIGPKCTKCSAGYYGLEETNPHGCRQCFCYRHSTVCKASPNYSARNITSDFTTGLEGWTVENQQGKDVTDQYAVHSPSGFISMTAVGKETLYARASLVFYGNRRSSYGQLFGFRFRVGSTEEVAVDFADVTLEGEDGLKITTQLTSQKNPKPTTNFQYYIYRLHEHPSFGWEPKLNGYDFQKLLTNLRSVKIRVNYADQGTGMLDEVFFESTVYDPATLQPVNWVEQCDCLPQYRGSHCEHCNEGFTRENGVKNPYGLCVPCECYGHSKSPCHPVTGKCLCIHNTAGAKCDECLPGYYGNPTRGTPNDCKKCPCVFGTRCVQVPGKVVCTDCPPGHTGNLCDRCQDGYFGDPKGLQGKPVGCKKCNCSGNIDPNAIGSCDPQTGECLKCIYNTRNGPFKQCELCAIGYYGNATHYPKPQCEACDCYAQGTVSPPGHDPTLPFPCDSKGRCTCLPNVVGDKCDSCISEYWNVGSGRGCEQCQCDPIGSYNNTCDVRTGQCPCKPGVTGRMCDQCKVDHYAFSSSGCLACNCNPQGSLNVTCNEQGVCNCRPGVLGIKCDSCRENYHNLTAGCIACPPCYDTIQTLVKGLRTKLHELIYIIERFNTTDRRIIDVDFETRLKDLTARVNKLLAQAEAANNTDSILQNEIAIIDKRVDETKKNLVDMWTNTTHAYEVAEQGASNLSVAENSLNISRHLLDQISKLLKDQGAKALNDSVTTANSTDANNQRMREILEETRKLANKHEAQADEITTKSQQAATESKEVVKVVDEAVGIQNQTSVDIEDLYRRLEETEQLQVMAKMNATEAESRTSAALDEANELFKNGSEPLPDLNITAYEEKANMSKIEAETSKMKSEKMMSDLKGLVTSFNAKEDDVRKKMAEWPGLLDKLKKLLADIDNANATAWEAFLDGENTLKKAMEMKDTLEKFNSIIEKSRKDAEKAEANIPEIERLIESANDKSDNATSTLGDAQTLAEEAKDKAQDAKNIAEETQKKAAKIRDEAENLKLPKDTVSEPAKRVAERVVALNDKAKQDKVVIDSAKDKAQNATEAAKRARDKIQEVLDKLLALLKAIDGLDSVNTTQLATLEKKLQKEVTGLRALDMAVNDVEQTQTIIRERIKEYTVDLERLKREMKKLSDVVDAMPLECVKKVSEIESRG